MPDVRAGTACGQDVRTDPAALVRAVQEQQGQLVTDRELPRFPALTVAERHLFSEHGSRLAPDAPNITRSVPVPLEPSSQAAGPGVRMQLRPTDSSGAHWTLEVLIDGTPLLLGQLPFTLTNIGMYAPLLGVVPAVRRRGVGSALIGAGLDVARALNVDVYAGMVSNPQVARTLPALGFVELPQLGIAGHNPPGRHFARPTVT